MFRDGKITDISVDSSAARNGVLINHQLLEVRRVVFVVVNVLTYSVLMYRVQMGEGTLGCYYTSLHSLMITFSYLLA